MTIVSNTANDPERHRRVLAGMIERQVDGLILATATLREPTVEDVGRGSRPDRAHQPHRRDRPRCRR